MAEQDSYQFQFAKTKGVIRHHGEPTITEKRAADKQSGKTNAE